MINLAMVGLGYWGPNLLRNLASLEDIRVSSVCDLDLKRAAELCRRVCPDANVVSNYKELVQDSSLDAVVIATPIRTHFDFASAFLSAGKHVLVEKPLAYSVEECQKLVDLAQRHKRVLMVGHVFEYSTAVRQIKQYLARGELGKLFYIYSQRVNLGRIRHDVNALWSFAPHDVSIINYWLDSEPTQVVARGFSFLNGSVEDVVFLTLEYPGGIGVHLHLGWLDPRKVRLMTLVGSKKMLVYDDVSLDAKIQLYDKGVANLEDFWKIAESFAEFHFKIRVGDVVIPRLKYSEPLQDECRHFIECIKNAAQPLSDGASGIRVVRALEAAERSLKQNGRPVQL